MCSFSLCLLFYDSLSLAFPPCLFRCFSVSQYLRALVSATVPHPPPIPPQHPCLLLILAPVRSHLYSIIPVSQPSLILRQDSFGLVVTVTRQPRLHLFVPLFQLDMIYIASSCLRRPPTPSLTRPLTVTQPSRVEPVNSANYPAGRYSRSGYSPFNKLPIRVHQA